MTSASPWMRQMPSVTEITVPCVRASTVPPRFWIRLLMSSLISEGLSCMDGLLGVLCSRALAGQGGGHGVEAPAHGRVDHLVADDDARTADQLRIDLDLRRDL